MSRTLTAMFDSRADAEAAKARLIASHVDTDHIRIVEQGAQGDHGIWASLKSMFVADEDRHAYGEGIRRGAFLLTADVEEGEADGAVRILDEGNSVDLDKRTADWRGSGWTGEFADKGANTARTGGEEVIPVVEEKLHVGKREVSRGGARVRSYVRETPVEEQVSLREEHVNVERRPVDRALGAGELTGDAFRERSIEMTATAEEAVVGKEARVVEEVVVSKTADTRTETVRDTVRRTEVEVDNDPVQKFAGVSGSGTTGVSGSAGTTGIGSPDTTTGAFGREAKVVGKTDLPGTSTMDDDRVATGIGGAAPLDGTRR